MNVMAYILFSMQVFMGISFVVCVLAAIQELTKKDILRSFGHSLVGLLCFILFALSTFALRYLEEMQ